ncbi:hypothetical protein D9756_005162 [Leucocoprinus leucothites]|uniref:Uncharacterized protein n=1 Tax=Leucocoprinus leucothites TaxID=201217 RepID=A0A8H5G9Q9_9AGAR|nr:hypothetical protein D9756_005162 [Leucoagaricus leucothites]
MGKSKSKKGQLKRYSTPADRYLIITDPWGGTPWQANFFNNVTAWFEIMLKPQYPGSRNVVVELPDYIDVTPLLGAHYWKEFLVPPHCFNVADRASYIYEFDYRNHAIPPTQGIFFLSHTSLYHTDEAGVTQVGGHQASQPTPRFEMASTFATHIHHPGQHQTLHSLLRNNFLWKKYSFLDKYHSLTYRHFLLCHHSQICWTCQGWHLSREETGKIVEKARVRVPEVVIGVGVLKESMGLTLASISSPLSSQAPPSTTNRDPRRRIQSGQDESVTLDLPHQPPGHLSETAEAFLATIASASTPNITGSSSSMPPPLLPLSPPNTSKLKMAKKMDPYEEEEQAMTFLRQSSTVETTTSTLPSYSSLTNEPSIKTETESKIEVKHEPRDHTHEDGDGYTPSTDLLDAFSSIQSEIEDVKPSIKEERVDPMNEDEDYRPSEELEEAFSSLQDPEISANHEDGYTPSEDLLLALASLPQDMIDFGRRDGHVSDVVRVKDEPRDDDDFRIPSWPVRLKREPSSPEEASGALYAKRVKLEQ